MANGGLLTAGSRTPVEIGVAQADPAEPGLVAAEPEKDHPARLVAGADGEDEVIAEDVRVDAQSDDFDVGQASAVLLLDEPIGVLRGFAAHRLAILHIEDEVWRVGSVHDIGDAVRVQVGVAHLVAVFDHRHLKARASVGLGDDGKKCDIAFGNVHLAGLGDHGTLLPLESFQDRLGATTVFEGLELGVEELEELFLPVLLARLGQLALGFGDGLFDVFRFGALDNLEKPLDQRFVFTHGTPPWIVVRFS